MKHDPRKNIFRGIGVIFFIFIIIFGYSRFGRYINGPQVSEISVQNYQEIDNFEININGVVMNTEIMKINGRMIILNDKNEFSELIALSSGNNILSIYLEDSFGKTEYYEYYIYNNAREIDYKTTYEEAIDTQEVSIEDIETLTIINE